MMRNLDGSFFATSFMEFQKVASTRGLVVGKRSNNGIHSSVVLDVVFYDAQTGGLLVRGLVHGIPEGGLDTRVGFGLVTRIGVLAAAVGQGSAGQVFRAAHLDITDP